MRFHIHLAAAISIRDLIYLHGSAFVLCRLHTLDLSSNELRAMPAIDAFHSTNMRRVYLGRNFIASINLTNGERWSSLEWLDISCNLLSRIPPEIGNFAKLTRLDISHNANLAEISDDIGRLSSLSELILDGLKLNNLPNNLATGPIKEIIRFLQRRIKQVRFLLVSYDAYFSHRKAIRLDKVVN